MGSEGFLGLGPEDRRRREQCAIAQRQPSLGNSGSSMQLNPTGGPSVMGVCRWAGGRQELTHDRPGAQNWDGSS